MKRFLLVWLLAFLLLPIEDISAKFYRYVDENGVTRFTDNIEEVPEDQKPAVYESIGTEDKKETGEQPTEASDKTNADADVDQAQIDAESVYNEITAADDDLTDYQRLDKTRRMLAREYRILDREKKRLLREKKLIQNEEDMAAYKKKVAVLNRRITAFEKERKKYELEAGAYNTER
jgi:hypothetical protein